MQQSQEGVVTELGILRPGPAPQMSFDGGHKRKRSHYSEHEIHSSQASIQEDDLPSVKLTKSPRMNTQGVRMQTYQETAGYYSGSPSPSKNTQMFNSVTLTNDFNKGVATTKGG